MKNDYFSSSGKSDYRCWPLTMLLIAAMLTAVLLPNTTMAQTGNIQGIAPVISPHKGTAIDGNAYANWQKNDTTINGVFQDWSTSGDIFYWGELYPGLGAGVLDVIQRTPPQLDTIMAPMPYTPGVDKDTVIVYRDGIGEFETSVYEPGTKINGDPNTYHWLAKPVLAKNEIQNAGILFTWGDPSLKGIDNEWGDPNDLWCAFAADRQAITGSSFIEIEVLQNKMWLDSIPVGNDSGSFHSNGPHGGRTIGDYGVTVEFTQGGAEANVIVTRWTYDGLDNKGDSAFSYHEVPSSLVDSVNGYPYGSILATVNTEKTYVHFPAFGQIESVTLDKFMYDGTPDGDTTLTLPFYQVNQWCEGAFNISALFELNENPCFVISTVNIRTKTSGSSDQANVVDFPGPPIQLNITADPPVAHCPGDSTYEACVAQAEAKWDAWKNEFYHVAETGKDPVFVNIDGDTIPDNLPPDYVCEGFSTTVWITVVDDCGKQDSCAATFTIAADDQPPMLDGTLPTGQTGISGCIEDAPDGPTAAAIAALYADDCGNVNVNKTGSPTGDDCSWSVTYVFSIKDDCENYADTVRITYSGGDDQPPTLEGTLPTGETGISGCIEDAPDGPTAATIAALYSDDCGNVNVNKTGSPTGDDCSWSVTYVFSIKDDCENYADTVRITYSGGDDEPPMITCPANVELACDELPNITLPTATDNCDDSVDVTWKRSDDATGLNDPVTPGATVTVTVYANDGCNIDSCQFTITAEECGPHIFPTGTECYNYNNCPDETLDTYNLDYICIRTDKDDIINKVVPGAMIYFTHLTLPAGTSQIQVKQANDCGLPAFNTISLDVKLYDSSCNRVTDGVSASESAGVVTIDVTGAMAGDYVLYVKYDPKTNIGQTFDSFGCEYEFTTEIDGTYAIGSYGTLELRSCNNPARYTIVDCQAPIVESATIQEAESFSTESLKSTNLKVYPNPFSETVTFEFTTHSNAHATLEITNLLGQKVATLLDGPVEGGVLNRLEYTPVNETPGMLIYRLIINESVQTGRIIYQN